MASGIVCAKCTLPEVVPVPTKTKPLALSCEAAAEMIGVHKKTLQNWRTQGIGPAYLRIGSVGSRVIYRLDDLEDWINSRDRIGGQR